MRASVAWFAALGWTVRWIDADGPDADPPPSFAAVRSDLAEIFLCVGAQGSVGERPPEHPGDEGTGGVWMTWWLDTPAAVDAAHREARSNGIEVTWPPTDEPWGVREMHLRHPDGHTFRVSSGL